MAAESAEEYDGNLLVYATRDCGLDESSVTYGTTKSALRLSTLDIIGVK